MHQNSAEQSSSGSSRSPENFPQQSSTNRPHFSGTAYNHRFAITAESMGLRNLRSDMQIPQDEPPLVDVKSYNERHNNKLLVKIPPDSKHDSNESFHSPYSNTPTNSCVSLNQQHIFHKANSGPEYMMQSPSPSISVSPKMGPQQWNFEDHLNSKSPQLVPKCSLGFNFIHALRSFGEQNDKSIQICQEQQLKKTRSISDTSMDNSAQVNFDIINNIYAQRIEDIDESSWEGKDLKICTYGEWVDLLTSINKSFITNMEELEREVEDRLNLTQKRVNSNCRHSQGNELLKCRKDINTLLKYIRNARNCNDWDLQDLTFETIKPSELFAEFEGGGEGSERYEIKNFNDPADIQRNKLYANMKALAHEVAEKHDEVRELKRQVICLEDEIQKAQKKIQLKDNVIKELRNDLKCTNNNKPAANQYLDYCTDMPPINYEHQTSRSVTTQPIDITPTYQIDNSFDCLSNMELEEQQKFRVLNVELSQLFEINQNATNQQQIKEQRQRVMDTIEKIQSEKAAAYHKLYNIRRQLIDLESNSNESNYDCDSGFHSKSENDGKILDAVRKRLQKLSEMNGDLKRKLQQLELDKNQLCNTLQSQKLISERNSEILKQIADLLCLMQGQQFSYNEVYEKRPNPFCEAIMEMQNHFQERENQLLTDLEKVNQQKEELTKLLLSHERDFSDETALRENSNKFVDIDNNTTTSLSTTSQPQLQLQPQLTPVTVCTSTESPTQVLLPTSVSASPTGQLLDSTTATSLQGLVDK